MKLTSLHIERFAGLCDKTIAFSDGINLFYGDNEAGKTTVCECLLFVFYGFADKKQRLRFCPWDSDYACATLCLEKDSRPYRIERRCSRDGTDTYRILQADTAEQVFAQQQPWEVFLGIPLPLYRRSAFVGQNDGAKIEGRPIADCIEGLLLAADETVDVSHALKQLDEARIPLLYKHKNGGLLFELQRKIDAQALDLKKAQTTQSQLLEAEHNQTKLQADYDETSARLEEQERLQEFYEEGKRRSALIQLNAKKERASQSAAELATMEQKHTQNDFFPNRAYISTLESLRTPYVQAKERCTNLEEQCGALSAQLLPADVDSGGLRTTYSYLAHRQILFAILTLFFLALTVAAPILCWRLLPLAWRLYAAIGVALTFLLASTVCLQKNQKAKSGSAALYQTWGCDGKESFLAHLQALTNTAALQQDRRNEYNRLYLQYQSAIEQLNALEEQITTELARWGKTDLDTTIELANSVLLQHLSLSHKAELAASELQGYQILLAVSAEEAERFHSTPYDFQRFEACNGDTIKTELTALHQKKDSLYHALQEGKRTIAVLHATLADPAQIQEQIRDLKEKSALLQQMHDGFVLAHSALTQARNNIHEGLAPILTEKASAHLEHFTNGRYSHLQIASDLQMEYAMQQGQRTHTDDFLSAATRDAAYLSLRLALAHTLFEAPLPLIFDESFSRMDDHRYRCAVTLLQQASQKGEYGQILLLTSQKRDMELAQQITGAKAITL